MKYTMKQLLAYGRRVSMNGVSVIVWGLLCSLSIYSCSMKNSVYRKGPSNHFRQILNLNIGYVPVGDTKNGYFYKSGKGQVTSRFAVSYGAAKAKKYAEDSTIACSKIFFCNPTTMTNGEPDMVSSDLYEVVEILFKDSSTAERVYDACINRKVYMDPHRNLVVKRANALYVIVAFNNAGDHLPDIAKLLR